MIIEVDIPGDDVPPQGALAERVLDEHVHVLD